MAADRPNAAEADPARDRFANVAVVSGDGAARLLQRLTIALDERASAPIPAMDMPSPVTVTRVEGQPMRLALDVAGYEAAVLGATAGRVAAADLDDVRRLLAQAEGALDSLDAVLRASDLVGNAHVYQLAAEMLDGLELIPPKETTYRGTLMHELDVDAVLARNPANK